MVVSWTDGRVHDVCMRDGRPLRDVVYADVVSGVEQQVDDDLGPVRAVSQQAEVAKRFFWTAKLALFLAQLVRELDEHLAVAVPLVLGEGQDAGDVVVLG